MFFNRFNVINRCVHFQIKMSTSKATPKYTDEQKDEVILYLQDRVYNKNMKRKCKAAGLFSDKIRDAYLKQRKDKRALVVKNLGTLGLSEDDAEALIKDLAKTEEGKREKLVIVKIDNFYYDPRDS